MIDTNVTYFNNVKIQDIYKTPYKGIYWYKL